MSPSAPLVSRYTYRLHVRASILEGLLCGILLTSDVVARKSLGASQWQIVLLTMAPAVLMLTSLFSTQHIESVGRRALFTATGVAGRLILLGMLAVSGPWLFLALLIAYGWVQSLIIPAQNAIYQLNYDPESRGRLFGRASTYGVLVTAATALGAGFLLDSDPQAFRWLYAIAGVAGFASCLAYGSIRLRRARDIEEGLPQETVALASVPEVGAALRPTPLGILRETLVRDAGFRRFETAMFVYGIGFMCMQPVFARLFVDELKMEYSDASLAKGAVYFGVHVVGLGIAGRMLDRIGLERLCLRAYVTLIFFAVLLVVVRTPWQGIAAFAVFGLGMSALNITWSMGPIHFAPPGASTRYMGVHVALVGVRALIGQILGGAVADYTGSSRPVFVLAALLFLTAALLTRRSLRLARRHPEATTAIPEDPATPQGATPKATPSSDARPPAAAP